MITDALKGLVLGAGVGVCVGLGRAVCRSDAPPTAHPSAHPDLQCDYDTIRQLCGASDELTAIVRHATELERLYDGLRTNFRLSSRTIASWHAGKVAEAARALTAAFVRTHGATIPELDECLDHVRKHVDDLVFNVHMEVSARLDR